MPWECQYILQILWVIVYTWRKVGTERLNGLSLVTQQVSVKYRTWAPFDFCFSPKPLCRGHRSSVPRVPWFRFCVLIYMVSFSTQPWSFQYSRLHLWSPPCSLTSAALMKCAVPNILLYAVESPQMPFQPQLILGVERRTYKKAMGRCSLWTLDKMELDILQLSYIPMFSMENKIKVSRWGNVYFSATTLHAPPQIWQQFNIRKDFRPSHPFSEKKRPELKLSTRLRSLISHHSNFILGRSVSCLKAMCHAAIPDLHPQPWSLLHTQEISILKTKGPSASGSRETNLGQSHVLKENDAKGHILRLVKRFHKVISVG